MSILSLSFGSKGAQETAAAQCIRKWIYTAAAILLLALAVPPSLQGMPQEDSMSVQQHTADAVKAIRANDLPAAEKEYHAILAISPDNSQAWTGLGVLLYGSGRAQEAVVALHKALQLNPWEKNAELFLGFSEADLRQCDEATPILDRHFAAEPSGKLQRLAGLALLACESTATDAMPALRTAGKLKALYPADADVLYQTAELYTRLWSQDAAELITSHPDSYRVHQLAGEVYEAQGNVDQALREYKIVLEENPRLPKIHFRIGQLYLRKGEADADELAIAEFRAELKINPQSAVSELAMGGIDHHRHKLEDAFSEYQAASKLEPDLVDARVGTAQVLLEQHQVQASIDQLQSIIHAYPDNASAHYALMMAYRTQGKMTDAGSEMVIFKRLQQANDEQFKNKLDALLNRKGQSDETPKP